MMEQLKYVVAKVSSYDPENGFREWYELQPQLDENTICINLENVNEPDRTDD